MSSMDVADLNDYRLALKTMPDERLVMELLTVHHNALGGAENDEDLMLMLLAAKAEVLARMNYEKGVKK